MEILELITEKLIANFKFLSNVGYILEPIEIFNKDNPQLRRIRVVFKNIHANRLLVVDIKSRKDIRLVIFIHNLLDEKNLGLEDYLSFKNGNPPHYNPPFILDPDYLLESIDKVTVVVRNLVETDLKKVIDGIEWITIPSYDPRDQSNYH